MDARYSVYRTEDEFPLVICGTIPQCAKAMGIKEESFRSYASRRKHEKHPEKPRKWEVIREKGFGEEDNGC